VRSETRKAGVSYAVTNDGLELPVVDVTHPAFAAELSPEKQQALARAILEEQRRFARLPKLVRSAPHAVFHARLAQSPGFAPRGGHVLGRDDDVPVKLGPQNLGSYAVAGRSAAF